MEPWGVRCYRTERRRRAVPRGLYELPEPRAVYEQPAVRRSRALGNQSGQGAGLRMTARGRRKNVVARWLVTLR
jgi:hypothetical protein